MTDDGVGLGEADGRKDVCSTHGTDAINMDNHLYWMRRKQEVKQDSCGSSSSRIVYCCPSSYMAVYISG